MPPGYDHHGLERTAHYGDSGTRLRDLGPAASPRHHGAGSRCRVKAHTWSRRERERAAKRLMSQAFIEIRALAYTSRDEEEDPAHALERIRLLADACHNLPGAIGRRPPRPGDADPFIGPWRHPRERDWMAPRPGVGRHRHRLARRRTPTASSACPRRAAPASSRRHPPAPQPPRVHVS
jgi:hypothetical protein